jgi:hypothetical protein
LIAINTWLAGPAEAGEQRPIGKPVDYNRDIKPILSDRCYACHGPDEGRRKARLRLDVREQAVKKVIRPGNAVESRLIERVASDDPEEFMPPPNSKKPRLTQEQVDTFRRWIDEGAKFDSHWAFVRPTRPPVPEVKDKTWPRNPIDHFIAAGHLAHGLKPSPEADRMTLIRRLSFDVIGLPSTPAEVNAFVNDRSPDAYEKLVNRLLDSPHYGERMALYWLDLVRFADTGGYHSDNHRDVTLYRDYVIKAFNENKRFDQFTVEQLAGDLLPNPGLEQKIATGYNRLLMTTEEGGAQAKEYLAKYAADRVRNTSVVWLAATLGCAECHNHKFDPYLTKDFYRLAAFFADLKEIPVGRQEQTPLPSPQQAAAIKRLDEQLAPLQQKLGKQTALVDANQAAWEKQVKAELAAAQSSGKTSKPQRKVVPENVAQALAIAPEKRSSKEKDSVAAYHRSLSPELAALRAEVTKLESQKNEFLKTVPTTLISMSIAPRVMRILPRGNWLDDSGEIVSPAVPAFLASSGAREGRATRMDLARWLVSPDNPLVARVFVNRLWKLAFGQGIVKTLDDFGAQGELPSHPQLLDWLAVEFVDSGWNVRHLFKLMLLSSTYRQSSVAGKELRERDPANRWLARQNRFRIDAEMVRDTALEISGLLSRKIGGPSVKPYQPAGYWQYLNFPTREYYPDHGSDQYRRGLYTYWQRTFPHPSLIAFDAPSREECTVERPRSSTPLQALVLLNDPSYVEAARVFAEHIIKEGGDTLADRLTWAYRRALSREPRSEEAKVLSELYQKHYQDYRNDPQAARRLISSGESPVPQKVDISELATWTSVARVILNLHETITRN